MKKTYFRRLCIDYVSHKAFDSYLKATWHVNTRNKNKHISAVYFYGNLERQTILPNSS